VFLDESAALTSLVRAHAWSRRGERAPGTAPGGRWERVTILAALGAEGVVGAMSVAAATDGSVFRACLERALLPELRRAKPDAVLVMETTSRPTRPGPCASCWTPRASPTATCHPTRRT
jgi:hypothetical protein